MAKQTFDVFLSHHSNDKPIIERLAAKLKRRGITPWLDKWNLIPGTTWQPAIEAALSKCLTCAVFIGRSGTGPWQIEEMRAAIDKRVRDTSGAFRVIPVLLPGGKRATALPTFLASATWVEFRRTINDKDALHALISGIRGLPPGSNGSRAATKQRVQMAIRLTCTRTEFEKISEAAQEFLRSVSGDATLTVKYLRPGSVVVVIDCSEAGFQRLSSFHSNGKLPEVMGYAVEDVLRESSLRSTPSTEFSAKVGVAGGNVQKVVKTSLRSGSPGGMDKATLVRHLAQKTELNYKTAAYVLERFADTAIKETKKNGVFVVPGLGRFVTAHRKARVGINPQTGEPVRIQAKTVVKFRVAKAAKDAITAKRPPTT